MVISECGPMRSVTTLSKTTYGLGAEWLYPRTSEQHMRWFKRGYQYGMPTRRYLWLVRPLNFKQSDSEEFLNRFDQTQIIFEKVSQAFFAFPGISARRLPFRVLKPYSTFLVILKETAVFFTLSVSSFLLRRSRFSIRVLHRVKLGTVCIRQNTVVRKISGYRSAPVRPGG